MAGRPWNELEDGQVRTFYPAAAWPDIFEAIPDRSRGAIIQRALTLEVTRRRAWTASELIALRELWLKGTRQEVLDACGRHSWASIQQKAVMLGLRRRHSKREPNLDILRTLREQREKQGRTVRQVAAAAGYHHNQITGWENGKAVPTLQAVVDWCAVLGFDLKLFPRAIGAFDKARAMSRSASRSRMIGAPALDPESV